MTKSTRKFLIPTAAFVLALVILYHQTNQTSPRNSYLNQRQADDDLVDINRRISADCSNDQSPPNQRRTQDDPCVLEYINKHFLLPPSTQSYNFAKGGSHATGYSQMIEDYFKNKTHGTFIEVGAHDGEGSSNTLHLELNYGWTGLLIECNPLTVSELVSKNRKAWVAQTCLSTTDIPETVNFMTLKEWPQSAQLNKPLSDHQMSYWGLTWVKDKHWYNYSLLAFPLYSIIMASKAFKEIDFLSLDVQGIEIKVLKNFPFEKFNIKYILAEVAMISETEKQEVKDMMTRKGYKFLQDHANGYDYSFGRESVNLSEQKK